MKRKYYGYKNTKTNCLLGDTKNGDWVQISLLKYIILTLFGYMTKVEKITKDKGE